MPVQRGGRWVRVGFKTSEQDGQVKEGCDVLGWDGNHTTTTVSPSVVHTQEQLADPLKLATRVGGLHHHWLEQLTSVVWAVNHGSPLASWVPLASPGAISPHRNASSESVSHEVTGIFVA